MKATTVVSDVRPNQILVRIWHSYLALRVWSFHLIHHFSSPNVSIHQKWRQQTHFHFIGVLRPTRDILNIRMWCCHFHLVSSSSTTKSCVYLASDSYCVHTTLSLHIFSYSLCVLFLYLFLFPISFMYTQWWSHPQLYC